VLNVVLQIPVGGANGTIEPRGNEDADGCHIAWVYVEEAEHLRFGKSEGVKDCAGLQFNVWAKLDDELHADGPLADFVAFGHSQAAINVTTYRSGRPIADDGEGSVNVHSGSEAGVRTAPRSTP